MSDRTTLTEAQDLDAFLNHEPGSGQSLQAADRTLAEDILAMAEESVPVDPHFYHRLEQNLRTAARVRVKARPNIWLRVLVGMAGATLLLALLFLSAPRIHQLLGRPGMPATLPAAPGPSIQRITATPQPEQTPSLPPESRTATPDQVRGWVLNTNLPQGPASVPNYLQVVPGEPLTPQSALAMAERLGVKGTLYQFQGEGGWTNYTVSDGKQSVLFWGTTSAEFTYSAAYAPRSDQGPFQWDARVVTARAWLQDRGLLPEKYDIQPVLTDPNRIALYQVLEGGSLYNSNAYDPLINLTVDRLDGRVTQVIYRPIKVESSGSVPLRSAREAWDTLVNSSTGGAVYYQTLSFDQQLSLNQWFRPYTPGAAVDLYGYAQILQAVDPAQPPYVFVGSLTVMGSPDLLRQLPMRHYLHLKGIYQQDEQGFAWLDLQSWEQADDVEISLTGVFQQENGTRLFKTDQGDYFTIPDVPVGARNQIADGQKIDINGARLPSGEIYWQFAQTHMDQSDQNAQFGMLPLREIPEQAQAPSAPQTGYQPGDRVEALEGTSRNILYQENDGSKTLERYLEIFDPQGSQLPWSARLDGTASEGVENFQNLKIRVWGTYQMDGLLPVIVVDRVEPVDPDLRITPWFGKVSETTLDGKPALLITLDSGQQWVLKNATLMFRGLASNGWESGAEIVVEGYPSSEPAKIGGLPVLEDMSTVLLDQRSPGRTRETYQTYLDRPSEQLRETNEPRLPTGGIVESVQLVYYASSFQGPMPSEQEFRLLQPLWRFSGNLPDGRPFELLLPAAKQDAPK